VNVWHVFQDGTTPDPVELETVAGTFQTGYGGIVTLLSDQLFINNIKVRWLGATTGPETELFITPGLQGGSASPGLPGGTAFCIRLRTGSPGRSNRGRKYFSGLTEAVVSGNQVGSGFAGDLAAAVNDLQQALIVEGWQLAIASYTNATIALVSDIGFFDLNVDSMRRRLAGRGR
jgi:hypothetical protein